MKLKIIKNKAESDEIIFTLTGEMNIYTVVKLKEILLNELKSSTGLKIDLAGVDEADTSAFQLLLYLKREAINMRKNFHIIEMSKKLNSIFILYKETI